MVKKFKPSSPGVRTLVLESTHELTKRGEIDNTRSRKKVKPLKKLLLPKTRTCGRNNLGRITCRHRGGGHKRHFRIIDFLRDKDDIPAKVASIEYDPNRSSHIALLYYVDGEKRYIIAPKGLKRGDTVVSGDNSAYNNGNCMHLKAMPLGSTVHNIELQPGKGAKLVRSAGLSAQLVARSGKYATVKMPSGEFRLVHADCKATFGVVSNEEHSLRLEVKAGRNRWKGIRPTVR